MVLPSDLIVVGSVLHLNVLLIFVGSEFPFAELPFYFGVFFVVNFVFDRVSFDHCCFVFV